MDERKEKTLRNMLEQRIFPADQAFPPRWNRLLLPAIVILAFLIRWICFSLESTISTDGTVYVNLAEQWRVTGMYPPHSYLPLYPWLMKLLSGYGMSSFAAGIGINLFLGSLLPLVCYGLLRLATVRREPALAAALLAAVHPSLIELSINIQRDTPYLFFTGCAIFCGLYAVKFGRWYWWSLCSLFLSAGMFSRYEALELLPIICGYFLFALIFRALSWKKALLNFAVWSISLVIFTASLIALMNVGEQMARAYEERLERVLIRRI